jgi:hypothetical protein
LLRNRRERQRDADVRHLRMRGTRRRIQHVAFDRGAVALDDPDAARLRHLDLGTLQVVLDCRERLALERGISEHASVVSDQRHAALDDLRQPVRLVVEGRSGMSRGVAREQLGDEQCLVREPPLDGGVFFAPKLPGDDDRRDGEGRRRHDERSGEHFRAEAERHGASPSTSL